MNELIRITEQNGKKAVSARELYEFLGYDISNWKRWYVENPARVDPVRQSKLPPSAKI